MTEEITVEVRTYLKRVEAQIEDANREACARMALRVAERAQINIRENDQIDTGFMVNSIYVITGSGESNYGEATRAAMMLDTDRQGKPVDHADDMAPEEQLPADANAGVVVGAQYAVYQENKAPFLAPAGEAAGVELGAIVTAVYREMVKDESGEWTERGEVVI